MPVHTNIIWIGTNSEDLLPEEALLNYFAAKYWHHDLLSAGNLPGSRTKCSEQCLWHVDYKTEGQLSGTDAVVQWDHYKAVYEQPQQDSCKIHP